MAMPFFFRHPQLQDARLCKVRFRSPTWIGEGTTLHHSDHHPGLVGHHPLFELKNGCVTLRSTESLYTRRTDQHFVQWRPASPVSYEAGELLADVLVPLNGTDGVRNSGGIQGPI
jgi:hypothetical protein